MLYLQQPPALSADVGHNGHSPGSPRAHLDLEYARYLLRVAEENTAAKIVPQAFHLPIKESWLDFVLPESSALWPLLPDAKNPPA